MLTCKAVAGLDKTARDLALLPVQRCHGFEGKAIGGKKNVNEANVSHTVGYIIHRCGCI